MKRSLFVIVGLLFTTGCSGLHVLGKHTLLDGTTMEVIQMTSKGESGPKIKVLETHIFNPATGKSRLESRYSASGQGIVDAIISTSMPAAISGQFGVMAARARRPNKTTITQSGGGASATGGEGGSGGSSNSESSSSSEATGGAGGESESYYEGTVTVNNENINTSSSESNSESSSSSESSSESNAEGGEGGSAYSTGIEEGGINIDNTNEQEQYQEQEQNQEQGG